MTEADFDEKKLGGNISLVNFKLSPMEMIVVKKLVGNYARKLADKVGYKELKLRLKQHEHGKSFLNELTAEVILLKDREGGEEIILSSSMQDYNLYSALASVMEKLLNEAETKLKI
ncbi:MAG: hypothetical protein V1660_04850 [archaeon]